MKLLVFYQDGLGMTGAVPGEIQGLSSELAKEHEVIFLAQHCIDQVRSLGFEAVPYQQPRNLRRFFTEICAKGKPAFMLLVGFFIRDNPRAFALAEEFGIPVVLHPAGHLMDETFRGKIFTADPNVRSLEKGIVRGPTLLSRIKTAASPFLKILFSRTLGRRMLKRSHLFAVLSQREQMEASARFGIAPAKFVSLRWGMNTLTEIAVEQSHFFRERLGFQDSIPNYVYWGRIEWRYKGLDRLLAGVRAALMRGGDSVPFRVFLIGPDYQGGAVKVEEYIRQHKLEAVVHLVGPDRYTPGSKRPLRDADASILLSRWDGFPRALRESVLCEKPLLVSSETHFGDLIAETKIGICVKDADDEAEVATALLELTSESRRAYFTGNTKAAAPRISYSEICGAFVSQVMGCL